MEARANGTNALNLVAKTRHVGSGNQGSLHSGAVGHNLHLEAVGFWSLLDDLVDEGGDILFANFFITVVPVVSACKRVIGVQCGVSSAHRAASA